MSMKKVNLFGSSLQALAAASSAQNRTNVIFESHPDGDASKIIIRGTPGLSIFVTLPTYPVRGMMVSGGYCYVVTGGVNFSYLYQVGPGGNYSLLSTFGAGNVQEPCEMAANPTQIIIADGNNGGWIYQKAALANAITVSVSTLQADLAPITAIGNARQATSNGTVTKANTVTSNTVSPSNTVPRFNNPKVPRGTEIP